MSQKLVIVFGANGFLGSVLSRRLHNSGFQVLPVIRPGANKTRLGGFPNHKILEVSPDKWPQLLSEHSPDIVICAQWYGVSKKNRDDKEMQNSNIQPILRIAAAVKELRIGTFICFGSQAEAKESPHWIKEIFCNSGESAYGLVKANLHSQLESLFVGSNCRFVWARTFSVYGPSDSSDSLLAQLFESETYGRELVILNPSKLWSYLYEEDFAIAVELIINTPTISGTVNIGNPELLEIQQIVDCWFGVTINDLNKNKVDQNKMGLFPELGKLITSGWRPTIPAQNGIRGTRKAFNDRLDSK